MKKLNYLFIIFTTLSCAQFVPPTGGERDKTPPKLIKSNPPNKTLNFNNKSIELVFDEYIDVTSLRNELLIIPEPKTIYQHSLKNKTLKLSFDQKLDSNTTYTFNFRKAIKDISEQNAATNLKLVLSTGNKIDSLSIKGNVKSIQTKEPVLDATIMLYSLTKKDTLPLLKRKPSYFTKSDTLGDYTFENIKNDLYISTAFFDKNTNLLYDQKTEMFAFLKDTLALDSSINLPNYELYFANFTKNKSKRNISREKTFIIQFDKDTKNVDVNFNIKTNDVVYNYNSSSVTFYKLTNLPIDTLKATIILTDSLNNIDTLNQKIYFAQPSKNKKKDIQIININSTIKDKQEQSSKLIYNITFDTPLVRFDTTKVIFKTDTLITEKPLMSWLTSSHLKVEINTKAKNKTELIFPSNIFENYKGDTNAYIRIENKILQPQNLGTLAGKIKSEASKNIVQLINAETRVITQEKYVTDKFLFTDIIPSNYIIKVFCDKNNNNIWDPGNISLWKTPETILVTKEPIRVKANFEIKDILIN